MSNSQTKLCAYCGSEQHTDDTNCPYNIGETKPKFTPGPWTVSGIKGYSAIWSDNTHIATINVDHEPTTLASDEANAALIAAAPDLYKAIEKSIDLLNEILPLNTNNINHAHAELTAALEKARGES